MRRAATLVLGAACLSACGPARNYLEPTSPRYAGPTDTTALAPAPARGDTLRIVSFNIAYARQLARAVALLQTDSGLRDADVVLLQEMDSAGAAHIAHALGMRWVYYPAAVSPRSHRDLGNAVLSRWPITADAKLMLPHHSRFTGTQRIAAAASLLVRGTALHVYSVHLGNPADIGPGARRAQLAAVLDDAARFPLAIIGGDLNSRGVGTIAAARGFAWPTERGPRTTSLGRWDHVFLKGFLPVDRAASGTVLDLRGASDHRPVWVVARPDAAALPPAPRPP